MSIAHNTDERHIDARRAEHDAKRDMLDADKQERYERDEINLVLNPFILRAARTGRVRCDVPDESNGPSRISDG